MARNRNDSTFDVNLRLKDAGLIAADAAAQVGGSNQILDLGDERFEGRVILNLTASEVDTGDELYIVHLQFSDSSTFASVVHSGPAFIFGDQSTIAGVDTDPEVGQHELGFTNEINGSTYRYMRLYTDVTGTLATGINYNAHVAAKA